MLGREPIENYGRWQVRDPKPGSPELHQLLFGLDDIGVLRSLEGWVRVAQLNQTALARVMSVIYGDGLYVQDKLTNSLASLEWLDANRKRDKVKDYATRLRRSAAYVGDQFTELVGDVEKWIALAVKYRKDLMHHYDKLFRTPTATVYSFVLSAYWLFVLCMFAWPDFLMSCSPRYLHAGN